MLFINDSLLIKKSVFLRKVFFFFTKAQHFRKVDLLKLRLLLIMTVIIKAITTFCSNLFLIDNQLCIEYKK